MADGAAQSVDLTNCDREPIHLLGAIQPFGFLIVASKRLWTITHASRNVPDWLGARPADLVGKPLANFLAPQAVHQIRSGLQTALITNAPSRSFGIEIAGNGERYDLVVHAHGDSVMIDLEPTAEQTPADLAVSITETLGRLRQSKDSHIFHRLAVEQMRSLTGFDRVMIYRFAHDGSGEVIAEAARPGIESYLGLHYPASDIPRQARILYERNWLRIIPDIGATPILIDPPFDEAGNPLDLSMSTLRSVSPIHIEYLQNMSVGASMSVSILKDGKLWGLFACHHYSPYSVSFERRTAAELLGQMYSLLIENREHASEAAYEARARTMLDKLTSEMTAEVTTQESLADRLDEIADLLICDGVGAWIGDTPTLRGLTPNETQFAALAAYLRDAGITEVHSTHQISAEYPEGAAFADRAAGMLVVPLSRHAGNYIVFFRKESKRSVNWAGDPNKPINVGPLGPRLTPRKSFELWQETVVGQSMPWRPIERRIAENLRAILLEIVLQLAEMAEVIRRRTHERQQLLIAELHHRIRNILNLIHSIISRSRQSADSVEEFAEIIAGRIQSLGRAHGLLSVEHWEVVSLHRLIGTEAEAHVDSKGARIVVEGPDAFLDPDAFTSVALVFHEMITNAAKYGALSTEGGQVRVATELDDKKNLTIRWTERGGPRLSQPTRSGFGSTMIERAIPHDLQGTANVSYAPEGLEATFVIPGRHIGAAQENPAPDSPAADNEGETWIPEDVLVVEDNMIIALDSELMLRDLGVDDVRIASGVSDALRQISEKAPAYALIDVHLGVETGFEIAERLNELAIPFAFATGYGEQVAYPPSLRESAQLRKPYSREAIRDLLKEIGRSN